MTLLFPTLKRRKKLISSFSWKSIRALVGNNCTLQVGIGSLVGDGWFYHTHIISFAFTHLGLLFLE